MGIEAGLAKKAFGVRISQEDSESEDRNWNDKCVSKHIQQQV